jgi:voltage-gated sodium channel
MAKKLLLRLVHDRIVLAVIAANTLVLVLRGFPELRAEHGPLLFWLDYLFTAFFVAEMAIKLSARGAGDFFRDGWNRFDLVIVAVSTPVLLTPWWNAPDVSFVLAIRCARLLRLLRFLRFIPEHDRLWLGTKRALRASVGVFIGLAVYNLILGLLAYTLFSEVAPKYFENPILSVYSLFKIFTVEGWFEIPDYISAVAGSQLALLARLYFIFAVTTGGILGLSLANAVFVDEMTMDNTDELQDRVGALRRQLAAADQQRQAQLQELRQQLELVLERLDQESRLG